MVGMVGHTAHVVAIALIDGDANNACSNQDEKTKYYCASTTNIDLHGLSFDELYSGVVINVMLPVSNSVRSATNKSRVEIEPSPKVSFVTALESDVSTGTAPGKS